MLIMDNTEKEIFAIGGTELLELARKELEKDIFFVVRDLKILILSNGKKTVKINRKNFRVLDRSMVETARTLSRKF